MEDINYFKDLLNTIPYYRENILLCLIIEGDDTMLRELVFSDDFFEKVDNECKQVIDDETDEYFNHIQNLEESILENNY